MSVIRNMDALFEKSSCRIVFVNDRETGLALADQIRSEKPEYISEIGKKCAAFKRIGPLKIKRLYVNSWGRGKIKEQTDRVGGNFATIFVMRDNKECACGNSRNYACRSKHVSKLLFYYCSPQ